MTDSPHGRPAYKQYLRLLRPEAGDLGVMVVYGAATAVLTLAVPLTVDALISSIMFGTMLTPLVVLVGVLLGCLVLQGILRGMQIFVAEVIERRIFVRVTSDLSWRLPRIDISAFDNSYGPELVNRFFDTVTVQKSSSKLCLSLTDIVLSTIVGMTVLSFYHPFLLILALTLIAAIFVLVFVFGIGGVRTAVQMSIAKYETAAWLQELARHTTAFCTKGGATFAADRANELCADYIDARRKHFRILFRQVCGGLGLQILTSAAVLGIGGWLVISQQLTPGQLVASELIVSAVVANITKLGDVLQQWYLVCAAADKVGHLIDLPLERQEGSMLPEGKNGVRLQMHDVTCKREDGTEALVNVTLDVAAGERIALLGSTGGSSSYALDVLYGLRSPTSGYVTIDGIDLRQLRLDTMRDQVSLVHGTEIVEGSILQNLNFGRQDISPDKIRNALEDVGLLDEVLALPNGLETQLTTRGSPLSSSQCSRLMIARAIVREPRVLLLDGALDALPWDVRRRVVDHLFDTKHAWTLVVVSQVEDVIAACDRLVDIDLREAPNEPPPGIAALLQNKKQRKEGS